MAKKKRSSLVTQSSPRNALQRFSRNRKVITLEIIKWLENVGWEERPLDREDQQGSTTSFAYGTQSEFILDCALVADEEIKMLTLVGHLRLDIPVAKAKEIEKFYIHYRKNEGNFYLAGDNGNILTYIHSRSVEEMKDGLDNFIVAIPNILDEMISYIDDLVPSIIGIASGKKSSSKAIEEKAIKRREKKKATKK